MALNIELAWSDFKTIIDAKDMKVQMIDVDNNYLLYAGESGFSVSCIIPKSSPAGSDQSDFETNYLSIVNSEIIDAFSQRIYRDLSKLHGLSGQFTAAGSTTTNNDIALGSTHVIDGIDFYFEGSVSADFFAISIVDVDNVLGGGAGVTIDTLVTKWYVIPGVPLHLDEIVADPISVAGLYLRVSYTNSQLTGVKVTVNLYSYLKV